MNKAKAVSIIVILTIIGNIFLTITAPFLAGIAQTTNATLATSSNMSNYVGTSEFLLASPWVLYLFFNFICLIVIVLVLKAPVRSNA